ncbi:unnamed protein product [Caretta caretta]
MQARFAHSMLMIQTYKNLVQDFNDEWRISYSRNGWTWVTEHNANLSNVLPSITQHGEEPKHEEKRVRLDWAPGPLRSFNISPTSPGWASGAFMDVSLARQQ